MKHGINIRGVIVPPEFDDVFFEDYIRRGVITPESRVIQVATAAQSGDELDVYINSPGGFVFAANEIINALNDAVARGATLTITVGSLAASAAAAIALQARANAVRMHRNSKLMVHGAIANTIGGAEAHQDEADILAKLNADLKAVLEAHGVPAELIAEWFAEGREGWITATEALKYGLATELIDADDKRPAAVLRASDLDELAKYNVRIAACADVIVESNDLPLPEPPVVAASDAKQGQQHADPESVEGTLSARITQLEMAAREAEARARAVQAAKDKQISDLEKRAKELEAERDALREKAASLSSALADADARLRKLLGEALAPCPEPTTWDEALKACAGDYVQARRRYPHVFAAFLANRRKNN